MKYVFKKLLGSICWGNISNYLEFTKKNSSSSSQSIQEQSSSLQTFKKADIVGTTILDQLSDRNESFVTCKRKSNITQWFSREKIRQYESTQVSGFSKKNSSYQIFAIFFSSFFEKTFMFKLGIHSNFNIYIFDNS